ncbi:MAG: hypothetical protein M9894_25305 [Planctomycetes bacterium]|nr:hypothetical protein [Planctomycetota bacterium]
MPLEIVFLDGAPVMEVGSRTRLRVLQRDAEGGLHPVRLEEVTFSYSPMDWGRVEPTDEAAVGLLEVVRPVESEDLLLAPTYSISASLTNFTGHTFQAERRVRLRATAVEVELGFEVGQTGKWRRFAAGDLKQPIDWTKARIGDPATQSLVVRDGKPFVRLASIDALPAQVSIAFPNGETAHLVIDGQLRAAGPGDDRPPVAPRATPPVATPPAPEPPAAAPPAEVTPPVSAAPAPPEAPPPADEVEAAEAVELPPADEAAEDAPGEPASSEALRDELARLRRYVASFAGTLKGRPEPSVAESIRARIQREVDRVRELLERHEGSDHDALVAELEAAAAGPATAAAR